MTGALSTISSHLQRPLVVGTFTPVVVFVAVTLIVVGPLVPFGDVDIHSLLDVQTRGFVFLVIAVLSITGLLHGLNVPIVRFFEGYPWADSIVGRWRQSVHRERRRRLSAQWKVLLSLITDNAGAASPADLDATLARARSVGRQVNTVYPRNAEVLPTSFGNVIRAFEEYPDLRYGIAAVTMWPRLRGVMDREFAAGVDEAKTSLDFMLNSSVLSGCLGIFLLVTTLAFPARLFVPELAIPTVAVIASLLAASHVTYQGAVTQAHTWGGMVRSAFDLYRLPLLLKLGYETVPRNAAEECETWDAISRHMLYGDTGRVALPVYSRGPTFTAAKGASRARVLRMARSADSGGHEISLTVTNTSRVSLRHLQLHEPGAAGTVLLGASVTLDKGSVSVTGTGPYVFEIDEIAADDTVCLAYRTIGLNEKGKE